MILLEDGGPDGAQEVFRSGAEINDWRALHRLGIELSERGDHDGAVEAYRKALELGCRESAANCQPLLRLSERDVLSMSVAWTDNAGRLSVTTQVINYCPFRGAGLAPFSALLGP